MPFYEMHREVQAALKVVQGLRPPRPSDAINLGLTEPIWSLMQACWTTDAKARPSASSVLKSIDDVARPNPSREHLPSPVDETMD
jgi:hypothetical protein